VRRKIRLGLKLALRHSDWALVFDAGTQYETTLLDLLKKFSIIVSILKT
jgi:hypothetical protein